MNVFASNIVHIVQTSLHQISLHKSAQLKNVLEKKKTNLLSRNTILIGLELELQIANFWIWP